LSPTTTYGFRGSGTALKVFSNVLPTLYASIITIGFLAVIMV
jgi:hypothetical protein